MGGTVGFNLARIQVTSTSAPSRVSGLQSTPAFGLYIRTPDALTNFAELRCGYESAGAEKTIYYEYQSRQFLRIYDRYTTLPVGIMVYHHLTSTSKFSIGAGVKTMIVLKATTRHDNTLPSGTTGVINNPTVKRFVACGTAEIMYSASLADIGVNMYYAFTPAINDYQTKVVYMGLSLTVKKRVTVANRYRSY